MDDVEVWVNGAGLKGVWVDKGNTGVGKQGGIDRGLVGVRKGKPGTTNSGLDAMVGDQGTVGDWVWLGYWR